nr:methyltransferase domain-containing protein [Gemmatimonadota bacterium]
MTIVVDSLQGRKESEAWEADYFRTRRNRVLRRRRMRAFGFQPSERIAELGCGDGLNLEILRAEGCGRLLGLDISLQLLAHVPATAVAAADMYRLPLRDASLDAVLVDSVLHHLQPLFPALEELARVLRPGGRACILEPRPTFLRRGFEWAMDHVPFPPPLQARQRTYLEEREVDQAWNRYFPRLEGDLDAAGLEVVHARGLPVGVALQC